MSIGLGNIIVQNKKEPAGVSEAESGLHMDGSKARLGGMLLENTDIDIDTKTFFLQWDGGAGAFLIDVFDDKYFFGTIDGSFNLETGFIFKENEAAVKLNGNAAVSARGQAGIGAGIVYEIGDVENVNNGTKITITEDTETVEITNIPNVDFTNMPVLFLDGNKLVKGSKANLGWQNFTASFLDQDNINTTTFTTAKFCTTGRVINFLIILTFKVTDEDINAFMEIDISDILTISGLSSLGLEPPVSTSYTNGNDISLSPNANPAYITSYNSVYLNIIANTKSGSETALNYLRISGTLQATTV